MDRRATPWTRERVESRLIAAFKSMPGLPVYRLGAGVRMASGERASVTDVLEWAALLDDDRPGRTFLWAWARCRATRASFGALCKEMRWSRSTAEDGRRRAAGALVLRLSSP